mgnify:CR=1 FL=1
MLTANDLQKIGNLIDERLEVKLEEKLEEKLDKKLKPIHRQLRTIQKTLDTTIRHFDIETTTHASVLKHHDTRLTRVENHVALQALEN